MQFKRAAISAYGIKLPMPTILFDSTEAHINNISHFSLLHALNPFVCVLSGLHLKIRDE